ncbi:MAG: GntR family transcriptional regulator [Pyramidobacter sp.]|jgi:GntR family transcriptional regulator
MVDKTVITPLYMQIADELHREILMNRYGEHGCIGTHSELARRFSVSLITIRKAVQILAEKGIVEILQGKGTYVKKSAFVDPLKKLTGISNIMSDASMENEISVPVFEHRPVPDWMEARFRNALGQKCLFIRRIVSVSGRPLADADMYLPEKYSSGFTREEVVKNTVYQIYQQKLGVELGRGHQIIRAAGADAELSKSLKIAPGAPVLQIERQAYDSRGSLIEYMILSYEASKYCFEVELELSR